MDTFNLFPWSDNWWLEDNKAWFVIGARNILCCFDMKNNECDIMAEIPDSHSTSFRATSYCMKLYDDIYCFPVNGSSIWVYDVQGGTFSEISIDKQYADGLEMHDFWEYGGRIFAVSIGLRQIIEIDTKKKKVENFYNLGQGECVARSVKVGSDIYILSGEFQRIYKFDLITKEITAYELPQLGRRYNTICFDEANFWLGGYRKEIYRWNKRKNTIDIYDAFPEGTYKSDCVKDIDDDLPPSIEEYEIPIFLYSITVGKYNWFIPFQMNKIIYTDKQSDQLFAFEVAEETQHSKYPSGDKEFKAKYILEYVKGNRYIGLFSINSNQIVEIDAEELTYKWRDYCIGDKSLKEYVQIVGNIFYEGNMWDREVYRRMILMNNYNLNKINNENVGAAIYVETKK